MRIAFSLVGCLPVLLASECEDIESNEDFSQCKSFYQEQLLDCSSSCKDDPACESQCSRDYDENLKSCPCQEYCPDGCPCPTYECGPNYDTECGQADPSLNWFSLDIELEDGTKAKKCFAFINEEEATQYAEWACNEHNDGNLLSVHSSEEWDTVMQAARSLPDQKAKYYIGYIYNWSEGSFGWTDGSPDDFTNFADGYPCEGDDCDSYPFDDATYFQPYSDKWYTTDQMYYHFYVCQMLPN